MRSRVIRTPWLVSALAALVLSLAGRADAFNIVFNGPSGFGISAASAASASAAGVPFFDVDALADGSLSRGDPALFRPIVDSLLGNDPWLLLADFAPYLRAQAEARRRASQTP